jgi:hypothetical protein
VAHICSRQLDALTPVEAGGRVRDFCLSLLDGCVQLIFVARSRFGLQSNLAAASLYLHDLTPQSSFNFCPLTRSHSVLNVSVDHPAVNNNSKYVRLTANVMMHAKTIISRNAGSTPSRGDVSVELTYLACINPGGWAPTSLVQYVRFPDCPYFAPIFLAFGLDSMLVVRLKAVYQFEQHLLNRLSLSLFRSVSKREYPRFLRTFSTAAVKHFASKPLDL